MSSGICDMIREMKKERLESLKKVQYIYDSINFSSKLNSSVNIFNDSVTKNSEMKYDLIITDPPYGDDGHKLFFLVQEPYWSDLIDFFDEVLG